MNGFSAAYRDKPLSVISDDPSINLLMVIEDSDDNQIHLLMIYQVKQYWTIIRFKISHNRLTYLSESIGRLTNLNMLDLYNNQLNPVTRFNW